MRPFYFLILPILFQSCTNKSNDSTTIKNLQTKTLQRDSRESELGPYRFDTTLKGGYTLVYRVDDTAQYLYLEKDTIIREIASADIDVSQKELGFKVADFKGYFILGHLSGSANNPNYFELIEKKTGNSVLPNTGTGFIDADESEEIFLYGDDVPNKGDSFILYNIKNGHKTEYQFPNEIFDGPDVLHRISIKRVNKKNLEIEYYQYDDFDKKKTMTYSR